MTTHNPLHWSILRLLQRSPHLRSVAYLGSMVALLEASYQVMRQLKQPPERYHQAATPAVALTTYAFARLCPDDHTAWQRLPQQNDLMHLGAGVLTGASAMALALGVAATQGWVSAPQWGWEQVPPAQLAQAIAGQTLQHAMVVWNEELVFRGYGFDTMRQAIGLPATMIVMALLFAVYHGHDPKLIAGMIMPGVMLTLLRLEHDDLWLPYGFHLGWNLLQVVVFGPTANQASLRPLHVHGPQAWIGQPGQPGMSGLSTLVIVVISVVLAWRLWKRQQKP